MLLMYRSRALLDERHANSLGLMQAMLCWHLFFVVPEGTGKADDRCHYRKCGGYK